MKQLLLSTLFSLLLTALSAQQNPNYEFRGVWVATVENIDWPSKKGLSVEEQKAEYIRMLEMHQRNGMNVIVFQVRPAADAFYPSQYEPWSEYLTGVQGQPPSPYYDPLAFMIEETHKRGMEFHAWLNPYRAVFNINKSKIAPSHITKVHPEWFVDYGDKRYFDPGVPEARAHVNRVVKDLVSRYDLDGIHMDDYFYPYRIAGKEFPDAKSFAAYGKGMNKDDWRRSNCDTIIKQLYETIKQTNARVKFGISPFGVWRNLDQDPKGSATKAGQTNYDDLYADILLWLEKGWMDYVVPQLYWERGFKVADYDVLLEWWNKHTYGKHLYIGQGIYRAGTSPAWKSLDQLPEQIRLLRNYNTTQGSVYFSSKSFVKNPNGWNDSLRNNYYAIPALVPTMPWLDDVKPAPPSARKRDTDQYTLIYDGKEPIKQYVLLSDKGVKSGNPVIVQWIMQTGKTDIQVSHHRQNGHTLFVAAVDKNNNMSNLIELN
ncbi:MAG: glycoside hydrolase family 10 protein [Chitinophagaceae bacterium]